MKKNIIILHGWGAQSQSFFEVKTLLEKEGYTVEVPDLPGFGKNAIKKESLTFADYVTYVHDYIKQRANQVIIIGHSFGGRIAIKLAALYPELIYKLILTGSSGIQHPLPSVKKRFVYGLTKIFGPLTRVLGLYTFIRKYIYYAIGEMDYYQAGSLTKTFKNVYQVSISQDLPKITSPTLLIWGGKDYIIPIADADYMKSNIKHSQLIIVPGGSHKLPYDMPHIFVESILPFLSHDK